MEIEDAAQIHELREWEARNAPRAAALAHKPGDHLYGPEECDQCEAPMPTLRREMGSRLCTACASAAERRRGR